MIKMGKFRRKAKVSLAAALILAQAAGFQSLPVHAAATGTVTCSVLNVRSGSSTNDPVITTVSRGTTLDIISSENGWYAISINGTTGYVSSQYVSTDGSGSIAVSGQTGSVNVSVLNLRSGASTDSSIVGALYMGETVSITESNNGWYGVTTSSGASGYVYAQYITLGASGGSSDNSSGDSSTTVTPATGEGVCNTSALNVRSDASTSASVIGLIRYGTKVTITGTAGSWYQVTTTVNGSSITGFVHSDYITMSSSGGDSSDSGSSNVTPSSGEGVCNTSALNIRKEPTTSSATYGLIRQGTKVTILGTTGEWYQVKTTVNGKEVTGYAHSSYITVSSSSGSDDSSQGDTDSVEAASGTGVCNTTALHVRKEASTSSKSLGLIYKEAKVTITGKTGSWYQVKATVNGSEVTGYVYQDYITLSDNNTSDSDDPTVSEVNETVWATTAVNVRKGCGTSYGIIATLREGASVKRTGVLSNGWSRVEYNGTTAYVSSQYLTTTDPSPDDDSSSDESGSSGITGVTGEDIAAYALQWEGYPYVWGGNNLNTGVDCSGFTQQVYLHFGIQLNRVADAQKQNGIRISSVDEAKPGDLFFYGSSSYADHVAIYIGNGQVIHASSPSVGIIISNVSYRTPVAIVRVIY